jgi:hypothetical protein
MKQINLRVIAALTLAILSLSTTNLLAQTDQEQRIKSAYILAFGRNASSGEVTYWKSQGNLPIAELVKRHQSYLKQDVNTQKTTIDRAYQDALGRNATSGEITYWSAGNDTYTTLMKNHVQWLQGNPAEYEKVINRSYKYVFGRSASADEIKYWKGQGTYSYLLLVGWHQDYKRRTQSGGSSNISLSPAVVTVPLSTLVLSEVRSASGIVAAGAGNIVAAGAGNIVAAGAGNIVAAGAGNIVAAGAGN